MFLRRRGDLADVMRELRGELFARGGDVDKYFNWGMDLKKCGETLEIEGDTLACCFPKGHAGAHESVNGGVEWWDENAWPVKQGDFEAAAVSTQGLELQVIAEKQWKPAPSTLQLWRIKEDLDQHIRGGPEREAAALRRARMLL